MSQIERVYAVNPETLERIKAALERLPKEWPDLVCDSCGRVIPVEVTDIGQEDSPEGLRWRVKGFQRLEQGWFTGGFSGSPGSRLCYCPTCAHQKIL